MKKNKQLQKHIAESFSMGNFKLSFPYLSDNIIWKVIGENIILGKSNVIENCEQTAKYFKSVQTNFRTEDVIVAENKVVIRGTGEFLKDGKRVNLISACDVYEFNHNNEIETILSYCISEKS